MRMNGCGRQRPRIEIYLLKLSKIVDTLCAPGSETCMIVCCDNDKIY